MNQITKQISTVGFSNEIELEISDAARISSFEYIPEKPTKGGIDPEITKWIIVSILLPSLTIFGEKVIEKLANSSLKSIGASIKKFIKKTDVHKKVNDKIGLKMVIKDTSFGRFVEITAPLNNKKDDDHLIDKAFELIYETITEMDSQKLSTVRLRLVSGDTAKNEWELIGRKINGDTLIARK